MRFAKEPDYRHVTPSRTAVLLINLGTPDAPTASAVRRYLKQFLSDPRVVEIPRAVWWFILHGLILPLRSGKSARKYETIWTPEGSPLKFHTEKQAVMLRGYLGARGHHELNVAYAMRYGSPSIPEVLARLKGEGCDRILLLPAYPQYSGTTTASAWDAVFEHYKAIRNLPELRMVKHYHDHPGYIQALRKSVLAHWESHGRADKLVMSFHGVPKRTLLLGDPYFCECQKTARLLAAELGLRDGDYLVTFQSRFGKAEWLQPYTAPTLAELGKKGVGSVDIMCPGFPADCLETLEEINMEGRQEFLAGGGKDYRYIPCLNESPAWIAALAEIAEEHLLGWPTRTSPTELAAQRREAETGAARATAQGAKR